MITALPDYPRNAEHDQFLVRVYTQGTHTSTITFVNYDAAKEFQVKLNQHNLTRKALEPEPLHAYE